VEILYSKDIAAAENKKELQEKLSQEYSEKFASPYQTASTGSVDEVIEPAQLRSKLVRAFRLLKAKREPGKGQPRGNIPL